MAIDREIKIGPKLEKRLLYLGFEEKNLNVEGLPPYKVTRRYFVCKNGVQVRLNIPEKDITLLNNKGKVINRKDMFKSSYIKHLTNLSNESQ